MAGETGAAQGLDALVAAAREGRAAVDPEALRAPVIAALRSVHDPEIPVNLYDLGLIYRLDIGRDGVVEIEMTLTAPACPVADQLPIQVREAVEQVEGVAEVRVDLVWDPPWDPSRMSEDARLALDLW